MLWFIYYVVLIVVFFKFEKKKIREVIKSRIFLVKIKMLVLFRGVEMDGF